MAFSPGVDNSSGGGNSLTREHCLKEDALMPTRKFVVFVDWVDGETFDSDEVVVAANSAESAISKARDTWLRTVAQAWPHCTIEKIWTKNTSP